MRNGIDYGIDPADFPSPAELAEMEEAWRARDDDTDDDLAPVRGVDPNRRVSPERGSGGTLSTRSED